ncbi:MAG: hypothetical protein OXI67_21260 [Candidatus Poribacteria bacterium]|nr:hypothetical protein [Candidatus Poribacteria bacterium]
MNHLKYFHFYFCAVLLFNFTVLGFGQGEQAENLVGHWTFEKGVELEDITGNFADITLMGAEIKDGQLNVDPGKWAIASGYDGPDIEEKTLVSWAIMDNLDVQKGSILTIDRLSDPTFDAIVFGERQNRRWMAGSGWFHRTQDPEPGFEEKKTGELIMMAISYENDNGTAHVKLYRNGDKIGDYTFGKFVPFAKNDAEAIWGKRHGGLGGGPGDLDVHIEDSRIYAAVLSQAEIKKLLPDTLEVDAQGKLATTWARLKTR